MTDFDRVNDSDVITRERRIMGQRHDRGLFLFFFRMCRRIFFREMETLFASASTPPASTSASCCADVSVYTKWARRSASARSSRKRHVQKCC